MSERSIEHSIKFSVKCISSVRKNNTLKEEEKITAKNIYDSLWKCRDFELSHLWQRSIFLTTFLVLCFTGYVAILLKLCEYIGGTQKEASITLLNVAGIFVAILGFILSVLWIMMAKGSKSWYEKYEKALYKIERDSKYAQAIVAEDMDSDGLMHGSLTTPEDLDRNLFSIHAGRFSPSKINIAIGQVAMVIWIVVGLFHLLGTIFSFNLTAIFDSSLNTTLIIAICICLIAFAVWKLYKECESTGI